MIDCLCAWNIDELAIFCIGIIGAVNQIALFFHMKEAVSGVFSPDYTTVTGHVTQAEKVKNEAMAKCGNRFQAIMLLGFQFCFVFILLLAQVFLVGRFYYMNRNEHKVHRVFAVAAATSGGLATINLYLFIIACIWQATYGPVDGSTTADWSIAFSLYAIVTTLFSRGSYSYFLWRYLRTGDEKLKTWLLDYVSNELESKADDLIGENGYVLMDVTSKDDFERRLANFDLTRAHAEMTNMPKFQKETCRCCCIDEAATHPYISEVTKEAFQTGKGAHLLAKVPDHPFTAEERKKNIIVNCAMLASLILIVVIDILTAGPSCSVTLEVYEN
jgi:hypothetical protein